MTAFYALLRKDLRLYFSNRRAMLMSLAAPIVIGAFFGYLFNPQQQKVTQVSVALADLDGSALSRDLVESFAADATIRLQQLDAAPALEAVRRGKVRAAVILPSGLGAASRAAMLGAGARPVIALEVDPSQPMVGPLLRGMVSQQLMAALGRSMNGGAAAGGPGFSLPFEITSRDSTAGAEHAYNGYSHSFGGMSVQFILMLGIEFGVGVLLARRSGLWQRYRAAPVSKALLLGSRIASSTLIALMVLAVIFSVAIAVFGVRIDGSWLGFGGVAIAFALLTASFGVLIAALGHTPETTRGLAIFVTLLMVMLGGAWVPSFLFPNWLQTASLAVPTRWAVDGFDAMTWRGLGLDAALPAIGVMLAFAALFALVAVWRFDWEE